MGLKKKRPWVWRVYRESKKSLYFGNEKTSNTHFSGWHGCKYSYQCFTKKLFDQLLLCRCAWFTWMKILEKNYRHIPFCPYPMECKRDLKPTKIINLRCYTAQKSMEIFFLFDNSSYAVIFIHDFCYCKMHYVTQPRHISFS